MELLPSKYHSFAIILSNIGKSVGMIFGALFFLSGISNDINYLLLAKMVMAGIILVFT